MAMVYVRPDYDSTFMVSVDNCDFSLLDYFNFSKMNKRLDQILTMYLFFYIQTCAILDQRNVSPNSYNSSICYNKLTKSHQAYNLKILKISVIKRPLRNVHGDTNVHFPCLLQNYDIFSTLSHVGFHLRLILKGE